MARQKKSPVPNTPPRRGAPLKGEPSARERILATASELFYREGIRAIGVDRVIAESGMSKASLYRTFDSKDALIAAFLTERDRLFWIWWDRITAEHADNPHAVLEALLAGVVRQIGHPGFRGCPFLNTVTEFPDETHPGRIVARANKDEMRTRLAALCARIEVPHPERLAGQLCLLINGAYVTGQMEYDADLAANLVEAAARLIG
jgi:AcrR family transcriptional regulator